MKNMKASMPLPLMSGTPFNYWAFLCGALLSRAHARSGDAARIAGKHTMKTANTTSGICRGVVALLTMTAFAACGGQQETPSTAAATATPIPDTASPVRRAS